MMLKVLIANAAAQLAAGVISNLPDNLPLDPEISNDSTKAENLMAFRLTHVFYDGLCRAMDPDNPQAWQTPDWLKKDGLTGQSGVLAQLAGLLPELLGKLVPGLPKPIAGPIPSPADLIAGPKS